MRSVFLTLAMTVSCLASMGTMNAYAFDDADTPAPTLETPASRAPGTISRYQREIIVTGGTNNPNASPQSQYFDDVMDHLEALMADEIAKNNKIAVLQQKIPGYKF